MKRYTTRMACLTLGHMAGFHAVTIQPSSASIAGGIA